MVTQEMIDACINYPVMSRNHEFTRLEEADYNNLRARGRTLYDNLRTQFDVSHRDAFNTAYEVYGSKVRDLLSN